MYSRTAHFPSRTVFYRNICHDKTKHIPCVQELTISPASCFLKICHLLLSNPVCSITDHLARRNLFFTKIMSLKTTIVCVQELTICPAAIYFSRKISHLKTQSCVFKNCQYPQPPNFFFPEKSVILNNHPVCSRTVHCPSRNLFFQKICH